MLDYKNPRMMQSFVTEHGRILPRRMTGLCAFHQRALGTALKKARQLAIVGYVSPGW
jgi:small subunit ribosomal protein S18